MQEDCAATLEALLKNHQRLAFPGTPYSTEREMLHAEIIASFLEEARGTRAEGFAAVVMAGAPGAGKSQVLQGRADLDGYFTIDSDRVKTRLVSHPTTTLRFEHLLGQRLPDGLPVKPEELATLVHRESTRIYDLLVSIVLRRGYNVILEGTLQWQGQGPRLVAALRGADYERLEVIAVEAPEDVAMRQAQARWWSGRTDPTRPLGGRFTPAAAIRAMYTDNRRQSICVTRAFDAFHHHDAVAFDDSSLVIHNRHGVGSTVTTWHRRHGVLTGPKVDRDDILGLENSEASPQPTLQEPPV